MTDLPLSPPLVTALARQLFGEPNVRFSNARELRFGRRGSLCVNIERGVFADHEAGVGGGLLAMMVHSGAARSMAEAAQLLMAESVCPFPESFGSHATRTISDRPDLARKIALAIALCAAAAPVKDTAAHVYLRMARGISAPLESANLGFLEDAAVNPYSQRGPTAPALVAAVLDREGRQIGAHLTFLKSSGLGKARLPSPRKMVGQVGGGHVPLINGNRLIVAEGIESALSAWEAATAAYGSPHDLGAIAALSAGGLAALHWPQHIAGLIIAPDADTSGAGRMAANALASRAWAHGLSVELLHPPIGFSDWNDAAQAGRLPR